MSAFLVDFKNVALYDVSTRPGAAVTASANGTAIDFQLTDGPVTLMVAAGTIDTASGDETYAYKIQESDTSSGTFTDISGASVSVTASNTCVAVTTVLRSKRWLRVASTLAGTTPSIIASAVLFARRKQVGSGTGYQS